MATVNEELRDAEIDHQINLHRFSNNVVRKILALLNRADADLSVQLLAALERLPAESFTVERLETLLASIRSMNAQAYESVGRELTEELRQFVGYETGYQMDLFRSTLPEAVLSRAALHAVPIEQVYNAVVSRPFQGRLLKEWAASLEADKMVRIRDTIRIGYTEGQTTQQIARRIRGTRANAYADGVLQIDRRNAEAVVRTAISHTAATARDRFYEENSSVIKAVVWTSTLDSRTTPQCIVRDGLKYTVPGHKPIGHSVPWLAGAGKIHWNCFPAGTLVTSSSPIRAVMKRWFDGDLVVINTASGRLVSCTPNHPILTARGWVAAERVDELDQVVCDGGRQWMALGNDDGDDVPARIEDVTEAFLASSGVVAIKVPVPAPYFHGDGSGSDVAVIGADRCLLAAHQAGGAKHVEQLGLVGRDALAVVLVARDGAFSALRDATLSALRSVMRAGGQVLNLFGCGIRHAGELLGAPVPRLQPEGFEVAQNDRRGYAKMFGDSADAGSSGEHCHDLGLRKSNGLPGWCATVGVQNSSDDFVGDRQASGDGLCGLASIKALKDRGGIELADVSSNGDSITLEYGGYGDRAEAKLAAKIIAGATGVVFLDNVVSVKRSRFSGHVFNLETEFGAYTANGIISHNCRSTAVATTKSFRELGIPIDEVPESDRASMDGTVPAETTYMDWLKKQSAARQDEILGPKRGALMRSGDLPPEKFFNDKGKFLTLDELAEMDKKAFKKAGL